MNGIAKLVVSKIVENITDDSELRISGLNTGRPLLDKIFTNGISYRAKEGRVLIIKKGNAIDSFFLNKNGYCFMHELLPNDFVYEHESEKWWIIPNPTDSTKVDEILSFLSKLKRAKRLVNRIKAIPNYRFVLETNNPEKKISDWKKEIHESTGVVVFQDWSAQKKIGFRDININTYEGNSVIPIEKKSPYLFASVFPYTFVINDQEDSNNIPTTVTISVRARNINPYVSEVESGRCFDMFNSIVTGNGAEIIRANPCHEASQLITLNAGGTFKTPAEIMQEICDKIRIELKEDKNFFGFEILEVDILQVEITGTKAEELKAAANKVFLAKKDNESEEIRVAGVNKRTVETANATNAAKKITNEGVADEIFQKLKAEADGKKLLGTADATAINELITQVKTAGGNTDLAILERIIRNYKPGEGVQINSLGEILNILNTKKTEEKDGDN